ncbi:MAG TPA: ATP-binding protein [Terracidiphilus sp.]|nr:ATP-binding protein [Terracidiphilus sp.]
MTRVLLSWSSGKDSAWTLQLLRRQPDVEIIGLLTTLNAQFDRVAMHGTRRAIIQAQADAAGLPLWVVQLPWPCPNAVYEQQMVEAIQRAKAEQVDAIAFGDLFLADVRAYRENMLKNTGIAPLFPLWKLPTSDLARQMIASGLRARVVCVDPRRLPASFCNREFDESFLADLPEDVDPCGERGEFHTCAYAGPCFSQPIPVESGEIVHREGFVFADLNLPSAPAPVAAA